MDTSNQEFMVGDRVVITGDKSAHCRGRKNNIADRGTIRSVGDTSCNIKCDNGTAWYYEYDEFTHDTDIKVGDRIRVTGSNVGNDYNGQVGRVVKVDKSYSYYYGVRETSYRGSDNNMLWCNGIKVSNDTPLTKDNVKGEEVLEMDIKDQVTRGGYVYTKLKSLSPKSIWDGKPCRGSFDYYVDEASGAFPEDQDLTYILDIADNYSDWLPWLIAHGYIGRKEVKKEKVKKTLNVRLTGWEYRGGKFVVPCTMDICADTNGLCAHNFEALIGKGPMNMTLTWEE